MTSHGTQRPPAWPFVEPAARAGPAEIPPEGPTFEDIDRLRRILNDHLMSRGDPDFQRRVLDRLEAPAPVDDTDSRGPFTWALLEEQGDIARYRISNHAFASSNTNLKTLRALVALDGMPVDVGSVDAARACYARLMRAATSVPHGGLAAALSAGITRNGTTLYWLGGDSVILT